MTDVGVAIEQVETGGRGALRMFLRNKAAVVGLVVFSLIVLVTIFGPLTRAFGIYTASVLKA